MSRPRIVSANSHATLQLACGICKRGRPKPFQLLLSLRYNWIALKSLRYDYQHWWLAIPHFCYEASNYEEHSFGKRVLRLPEEEDAITGEIWRSQEQEYKIFGDMTSCTLIAVARYKRIGETCCLTPHEFWYWETTSHRITSPNITILKVTAYGYYNVPPVS
jgi:hypothetical protein